MGCASSASTTHAGHAAGRRRAAPRFDNAAVIRSPTLRKPPRQPVTPTTGASRSARAAAAAAALHEQQEQQHHQQHAHEAGTGRSPAAQQASSVSPSHLQQGSRSRVVKPGSPVVRSALAPGSSTSTDSHGSGSHKAPDGTTTAAATATATAAEGGAGAGAGAGGGSHRSSISLADNDTPFAWRKGEAIGQGGSGTVFLAVRLDTNEVIAIKEVDVRHLNKQATAAMTQEVRMLRTLHHPNIVRCLGTQCIQGTLYILTEWVNGGSLHTLRRRFKVFSEPIVANYARQMLQGISYMHSRDVVHLDIKPANVLVDSTGVVKLADFGASRCVSATMSSSTRQLMDQVSTMVVGTPSYMAPEKVSGGVAEVDQKAADIWSFGCTVLELASGQRPWAETGIKNPHKLFAYMRKTRRGPGVPNTISPELREFLEACLLVDPTKRLTATQLLELPFVSGDCSSNGSIDSDDSDIEGEAALDDGDAGSYASDGEDSDGSDEEGTRGGRRARARSGSLGRHGAAEARAGTTTTTTATSRSRGAGADSRLALRSFTIGADAPQVRAFTRMATDVSVQSGSDMDEVGAGGGGAVAAGSVAIGVDAAAQPSNSPAFSDLEFSDDEELVYGRSETQTTGGSEHDTMNALPVLKPVVTSQPLGVQNAADVSKWAGRYNRFLRAKSLPVT